MSAKRKASGTREFKVHAVEADIVMNKFGLHVPNGAMYVLDEDLEEAEELHDALEGYGKEAVPESLNPLDDAYAMIEEGNQKEPSVLQPLVIRANKGETVEIEFVNHLNRHASIHQTGLPYDPTTSDGMAVGRNPDTTVAPGKSTTYRLEARYQGTHFFYDGANQAFVSAPDRPQRSNLLARGLFGAIVVEPEEATWTDPRTGGELRSGVRADIHDPDHYQTHYREFVIFYHSPVGVEPDVSWPGTDQEQSLHGINYRCDPTGQRVNDDCPECGTEKYFYHSWTNGDPGGGDNAYTAYKGDPIKFCFVGASHEENHVHHLHQHRHKEIPRTDAATIDAQTIGLGDAYEAYLVAGHGPGSVRPSTEFDEAFRDSGAGYVHGTAGDILFHCHLFPHYAEGMWGLMRVLDKEHDFLEPLPQTKIDEDPDDPPLSSGKILAKDVDVPGFPDFVGDAIKKVKEVDDPKGHAAPQPPNFVIDTPRLPSKDTSRPPTKKEKKAMGDEILPGAPYQNPVTEEANRVITYNITVTKAPIAYNDAGEYDPDGVTYVLEEVNISPGSGQSASEVTGVTDGPVQVRDADLVQSGRLNPEPLFLRANVGDCVRVRMQNDLDVVEVDGKTERWDASIHPHYVGYDVLASDSLSNGFNYYQADKPGQTIESRWYADEEGTIYFHDHIFAIKEGVHGMFCGFIVEPKGSEWRDPHSGEPVYAGAQADIIRPGDEESFREQALLYHDFAPLREPNGQFVNPETEHTVNKGTMAINYRNAPYYNRDKGPDSSEDPAYVHSSAVHGDPPTPVLEAYDGDPIRFRVFQGAYEEQHTFSVHGLRTERELAPTENSVSKYLGTSEAFTFEISGEETARNGDERKNPDNLPVRDYLYGSNVVDDLWTGMWGLARLWGGEVDHLRPLNHKAPDESLSTHALQLMGHPAAHSEVDWTEEGQKAKRLYSSAYLPEEGNSLLESDIHLPGSDWPEPLDRHRRLDFVYKSLLVPADVAARRNPEVGSPPPTPDPALQSRHEGSLSESDEADIREYDVTAFLADIPYNDYGDHDPYGVVFALDRYVDEIKAGDRAPEPLVLRANEGERLRVNLTNDLPDSLSNDHPDPEVLIPQEWERSDRISLHPLELAYDVNTASGAAVGFNFDTTVGPGDTYTYEWTADGAVGAVCLWDMADLRSTRHHGAFGMVTVNPTDAVPLTPDTAELAVHGSSAIVKTGSGGTDFREHGLLFADSQFILNRHDPSNCVVPPEDDAKSESAPCTQIPEDTEDQGYGAVNYRSEPFKRRLGDKGDQQHLVFDSDVHGDPNTPVVEATTGDEVRFRVACAGDKARGITFHLAGHEWDRFRDVCRSPQIGVDGQFGPGTAMTLSPGCGAGGPNESAGDFIYQETKQRRRLESGMWGIFRVHESVKTAVDEGAIQPLPEQAEDVSLGSRPGFTVKADTDFTGSGETDVVVGVPGSDLGAIEGGAVYVFEDASKSAITDLSEADLMAVSEVPHENAGRELGSTDRSSEGGKLEDGKDLLVHKSTGEANIPGGTELQDLIARLQEDQEPGSSLASFVRSAMPSGNWPVVPLKQVAS